MFERKKSFLTSLKQTCNEYLIKFSENQSAPKLENTKTSPCSPCAPNLLNVLVSRIVGKHNLCSPDHHYHEHHHHHAITSQAPHAPSQCWSQATLLLGRVQGGEELGRRQNGKSLPEQIGPTEMLSIIHQGYPANIFCLVCVGSTCNQLLGQG